MLSPEELLEKLAALVRQRRGAAHGLPSVFAWGGVSFWRECSTLTSPSTRLAAALIKIIAGQLAFRVSPEEVDSCYEQLVARGLKIVEPPTDHPRGHWTVYFFDPEHNLLEIYAEI